MGLSQGIRAGAAYVELYTKDSRLVKGLRAAEQKLKAFGAGIRSVGTKLLGLGAALGAPLLAAVHHFAAAGDQLNKMSARTGVSTNALSELGFAAEQSGQSIEVVEQSLRKMQKSIGDAATGSKTAQDAFAQIGVRLEELRGLSPDQQFERIADGLARIKDPTLRASAAMEIFGRSGTALLPLMADGAKGIRALREEAQQLGLSVDPQEAQAAADFVDAWNRIKRAAKAAFFVIGSALAPAITDLLETVKPFVVAVGRWVRENKALVVTFAKFAMVVAASGAALIVLGTLIPGAGAALGTVATILTGIGAAVGTLGSILAAILSPLGLVIAGVVALGGYLVYVSGVGEQALQWLARVFTDLKNDALAAFQGISDALAAGDIGLAAKILWLTLKMEWQKGIHWLQEKWTAFKGFFLSVWTEAVFNLSRILTNAWAGLQSFWTETVATMSTAWAVFASGAVSAWKGAQNAIAKGIVHLMGMLDDSVDVQGTLAILQEDYHREQQTRAQQTREQLAGIEQNRQRRQADIEGQRTGTLDVLEQDRERAQAEHQRQFGADLADSQDALDAARKEWEDALAQAARERVAAEAERGPERIKQAEADLSGLDELIDTTQRKIDVVGGFNPLAVRGLGADSLSERTAKASEQIAANTKRLVQEAQHGGLVFA